MYPPVIKVKSDLPYLPPVIKVNNKTYKVVQ
jgi:hypothetical protein